MPNVTLSDDLRERLGRTLSGYVNAGESQIGMARRWWETCREFYRNEPVGFVGTKDDPGYDVFHTPLIQPKIDTLKAQVCTTVGKQEPYMLDLSDEQEIANAKQSVGHRVWQDAGFEAIIRNAATEVGNTDVAYYRVCPLGSDRIEMTVHEADEVIVFPALRSGIEGATAVGHKVWKRRRDVVRDGKAYYKPLDDEKLPSGGPHVQDGTNGEGIRAGVSDTAGPLDRLDALVELWDMVVWLDLPALKSDDDNLTDGDKARWYRATVCRDSNEVLALEPYPFSRPWYFRSRFVGSLDFYGHSSVSRNLLPLQREWNNLKSAFYAGIMMAMAAPIFGPPIDEKYTQFGAFQYIATDQPVQPWAPNVHPQLTPIPVALQSIRQDADTIARISQNASGSDAADQTATEASIVASGVAVGLEEYISNFTMEFPEMMEFTMELVASDPEAFLARLAQNKPIDIDPAELAKPSQWTTKGQSPTHSPQAIVQAIQVLLPVAMNPLMAQVSGLQIPELVRTFVENSALQNADGILLTRDQIAQRLAPQLAGGSPGPMVGPAGGPPDAGAPVDAAAGGGFPPTFPSPGQAQ